MGKHQQRDRIARLISWGHWFTFTNIILCLVIGIIYLESASTGGSPSAISYLGLSWLGHFAFLPFVFFILLIFPFCLIVPYSQFLRGYAATIASVGVFTLLFDALFFSQYGFHLNTYALTQITTDLESWFAGASFMMLIASIFVFLVIFGMQLVFANLTWKKLDELQKARFTKPVTGLLVASFLLSHIVHIWADATLVRPITQQDDLFPLSYPTTAKTLMARHGWIDAGTFQTQRTRLTSDGQLAIRYPLTPLLCAKQPSAPNTLIIAFDQLDQAAQEELQQHMTTLTRWSGTLVGHPEKSAAAFQLMYGLPDIYQPAVMHRDELPAYQRALRDFGEELTLHYSENFDKDIIPTTLRADAHPWQDDTYYYPSLNVLLATEQDIESIIPLLKRAQNAPGQRLIVTSLTPANQANSGLNDALGSLPLSQLLRVPLWTSGVQIHPQKSTATMEDIAPSTLQHYMSCAENFRSFTSGYQLSGDERLYPRVLSIEPQILIFEQHQTTILDRNGELQVFDQDGQPIPDAAPATPVLIQSLSELQRFSRN